MKITKEMLDLWEEADKTLPFDSFDNPHSSPEAFARAEAEHFLALLGPLILEAAAKVADASINPRAFTRYQVVRSNLAEDIAAGIRALK